MVEDPKCILDIIESQYEVKFANFKPPRLRKGDRWGYISPIPVETAEMARKLIEIQVLRINIESLGIDEWKEAEIRVRQYRVRDNRGGDGTPYQGSYRGQSAGAGGNAYRPPYSAGVYGSRGGGYGADKNNASGYGKPNSYAEFKAQNSAAQVEQDEFGRDNSW